MTETGIGHFELRYLKNKEKYDIDFLILRNKKSFLAIEVKLTDDNLSSSWGKFMSLIHCPYGVQLIKNPRYHKRYDCSDYKILVTDAAHFLQYLV